MQKQATAKFPFMAVSEQWQGGPQCVCVLQRLFDYIGGKNEPNVKINMTAPVVTMVEHGDGPFCKSNFTGSFFVPFADQVPRLSAPIC